MAQRRWRRVAVRCALLLLAGAAVNVAVAWGLVATQRFRRVSAYPEMSAQFLPDGHGRVWHWRWERFGSTRFVFQFDPIGNAEEIGGSADFAPRWSRARGYVPKRPIVSGDEIEYPYDVIIEDAVGLPMQSLMCEHVTALMTNGEAWVSGIEGGIALNIGDDRPPAAGSIELRPRFYYSTALPLRPIWSGFVINTLFYAGVLWMIFFVPFAVRCWFRRSRGKCGLCPACAYPIGTSDVCTECGAAVKPRVVRP